MEITPLNCTEASVFWDMTMSHANNAHCDNSELTCGGCDRQVSSVNNNSKNNNDNNNNNNINNNNINNFFIK